MGTQALSAIGERAEWFHWSTEWSPRPKAGRMRKTLKRAPVPNSLPDLIFWSHCPLRLLTGTSCPSRENFRVEISQYSVGGYNSRV